MLVLIPWIVGVEFIEIFRDSWVIIGDFLFLKFWCVLSYWIGVLIGFKMLELLVIVLRFMGFGLGKLDDAKMVFLVEFLGFACWEPRPCNPCRGPCAQKCFETNLSIFLCTMPRHWFCLYRHAATLNKGFLTDCVFFGTFWLCFGLGLVLRLWYLDFKLGIDIVWV